MMIADAAEGEVLRMGWLKKQKKTWRKWVQLERRYFRLTKDALSYYKSDAEVRCLQLARALEESSYGRQGVGAGR